ncbi:MAG: YciI family protein [Acidimicrobiia bacterium]|nr:YciI family protein [Acidimicrobiia bacterium]MDX2466979.1 YciI family protein [Acidimicrobiia bacterium]
MSRYLLSVHTAASDDAPAEAHAQSMTPEMMQEMMGRIIALEAEMEESGTFVFSGRLADADAATVVRSNEGDTVMTDGPFVEAKEHIAGFYIIDAADLDAALAWASKVVDCIGSPIEVRPFGATGKVADNMPGA